MVIERMLISGMVHDRKIAIIAAPSDQLQDTNFAWLGESKKAIS